MTIKDKTLCFLEFGEGFYNNTAHPTKVYQGGKEISPVLGAKTSGGTAISTPIFPVEKGAPVHITATYNDEGGPVWAYETVTALAKGRGGTVIMVVSAQYGPYDEDASVEIDFIPTADYTQFSTT